MRLFGLNISRAPSASALAKSQPAQPLMSVRGGWYPIWPTVGEPYTGAWQKNDELRFESVLSHSAVYSCATLIGSDIAKMRLRLVQQDAGGIWTETKASAFSPVLRKPNRYQNRIQFVQWWLISKLVHGNTYILKDYDARGVVRAMYILDPRSTRPLVAPDGSIYYSLSADYLNGLDLAEIVPARMIIHDVAVPLYHPLCGISPILACALAVRQGLSIQRNSAAFFENGSNPGGVLTAPGAIAPETATRLKEYWDTNFAAGKAGKIAVLGDGLEYAAMTVNAVDAQLIDQLKWTAETVCSCFHVPPYMIGVGDPPNYNNIEALNQQYYSQCLQILIETIELLLDEGLELPAGYGTEFDIDDLLRMDSATMIKSERDAVQGGIKAPNESRRRLNLPAKPGGDSPYLQQQNYSLEALAKRDAAGPAAHPVGPSPAPAAPPDDEPPPADLQVKTIARLRLKAAAAGLVGR